MIIRQTRGVFAVSRGYLSFCDCDYDCDCDDGELPQLLLKGCEALEQPMITSFCSHLFWIATAVTLRNNLSTSLVYISILNCEFNFSSCDIILHCL